MGLCVGNTGPATSVGFPSLCLQDGPLGIRFADHSTAFPAGLTVEQHGTVTSCNSGVPHTEMRLDSRVSMSC